MERTELLKWVEISRTALQHNLSVFRSLVPPGVLQMAVVKSNAYGHGIVITAKTAIEAGADWLGVNELDEALVLRNAGIDAPVLILGAVPSTRMAELAYSGLATVVYTLEAARELEKAAQQAGRDIRLHIKLETGLNRQGAALSSLKELAAFIHESPHLVLDGLYTHFADIEDTTDHSFAALQLKRFSEGIALLEAARMRPTLAHCACSAAALVVKETAFDMIRVGIGMYGLWPSKETQLSAYMSGDGPRFELEPVMTWKTRIVQIKNVQRGSPIGYGCTEQATHDSKIAVLPVGYYDGYDRGLSSRGRVVIRGRRAHVRGRVCMNMMMVDVTHISDVRTGDEVILLGGSADARISAEFLASQLATINYEVVTRVGAHLPRVLVD